MFISTSSLASGSSCHLSGPGSIWAVKVRCEHVPEACASTRSTAAARKSHFIVFQI